MNHTRDSEDLQRIGCALVCAILVAIFIVAIVFTFSVGGER